VLKFPGVATFEHSDAATSRGLAPHNMRISRAPAFFATWQMKTLTLAALSSISAVGCHMLTTSQTMQTCAKSDVVCVGYRSLGLIPGQLMTA
jgi:riboflavin synthase